MLGPHHFNAISMMHASLVSGVVALGDRSFYLTLIFGTWCPFQGVRDQRGASVQRLLVWIGMAGAFAARAGLAAAGMDSDEFHMLDMVDGSCATVLLIIMTIKASCDLSGKSGNKDGAKKSEQDEDAESGQRKKPNESTPLKPIPQEDRMLKRYAFAACVTSAALGFIVLPDGQVDRFVLQGATPETDLVLGSMAGYTIVSLIAVIISTIMERTVPVKRLLFCNIMGLACLSLWIGSSTFMHFHKDYLAPHWRDAEALSSSDAKNATDAKDAKAAASSLMQFAARFMSGTHSS